ncbi:methyl-accepting chemotaxis protein [Vibrio albus]|uniref:Methyl-accepting chemotaxis protein n=1 Tax=Vibrio albus TaxID=2200953 RepID=A0A2U3B5Q8_9VIBR|nr:methyl-accepting chemotaxis protein [Vibrio albus]PWI32054.1 methyl-accepting chemotaxis protein [Vibrio albus]
MAGMQIKPWERIITDVRLVPKLIILMVFSSLVLVGKQLWDAHTFYHSVVMVQKDQARDISLAQAKFLDNVLLNSKEKTLAERAFSDITGENDKQHYSYLIQLDSGKVVGLPGVSSINDLKRTTTDGQSVSQIINNLTSDVGFVLEGGKRFEHGAKLKAADWVVVASQNEAVAQSHYDSYIVEVIWQTVLMIVMFLAILFLAASIMLRQTKYVGSSIQNMANRDLSNPIEMDCKDEYGDLARELESTRAQLQDMIKAQLSSSEELSALTEVMTLSMSETKESAQEEFAEIDQLATAMSEMTSTVQTVAEHAQNASSVTESASEQARTGQQFVQNSVSKMNELSTDIAESAGAVNQVEERVEAIGSVVGTIQGISEQTNLLALNAAIEAARAGEAGRGFAVVADEVRNLAQRTQSATVEIQEMISQLQASASSAVELMEKSVVEAAEGVELVNNAGIELDGIVAQVEQINDMNFQIATAAGEQSSVAEEMNQNLTNVRELVEASVTVVTELLETSEVMQSNAEELDKKIQSFKI